MIKVMVVDDDALVATGIRAMFAEEDSIEIASTASDGEQAIGRLREEPVDVVLMDLRMPGMGGVEATEEIKKAENPPRILALTTWNTDSMLRDALAAGVDGFLLKDADPAELAGAIQRVHDGHTALSPAVADRLVEAFTRSGEQRQAAVRSLARLSELEEEVARGIAAGLSNSEIAERNYMSVGNVKACVSRILSKLSLSNRVQIATLVHAAQ